jgi:hypothetical protein
MEKFNFQNRGQGLIGVIVVLAIVVLIGGGLYYYRSKQTQKAPQVPQKPVEEVKPKEATLPEKPKAEEETKNWKVYRNKEYGFEIKYPKEWIATQGTKAEPLVVYFSPGDKLFLADTFITVSKEPYCLFFHGTWVWVPYSQANDAQLIDSEDILINDIPFKKDYWIIRSAGESSLLTAIVFHTTHNNKYYAISHGVSLDIELKQFYPDINFSERGILGREIKDKELIKEALDKIQKNKETLIFNQMLSTFRFIETEGTTNWKVYTIGYEGNKCSIKYPPDWKVEYEKLRYFLYLTPKEKRIPEDVWVIVNCFPKEKGYTDQRGKNLLPLCSFGKFNLAKTEKFKGIYSKEFCTLSSDGSQIGVVRFEIRGGRQTMDYYLPDKEFEPELNVFNQMLSTFRFTKGEKKEGESYLPLEIVNSEEKLLEYLEGLYCGIECCGLSSRVYKKKLVKNYPEFYISECGAGGTCAGGEKMSIYFVEKGTGLVKIVWEEYTYGWPMAPPSGKEYYGLEESNVEFKDLDNDGNLEIIKNVVEMQCKHQEGCCGPEQCCKNGGMISKREYQKIFRWDEGNQKFVEILSD